MRAAMEEGYLIFSVGSVGQGENITFQYFTPTGETGAKRMRENLRTIRERNGYQHIPIQTPGAAGVEGGGGQ